MLDQLLEDGECDWLLWFTLLVTIELFDTSHDSLKGGGFTFLGRETSIGVKGADAGEIRFDCGVFELSVTKVSDPFDEGSGCCWKELTWRDLEARVELQELDK